MTDHVSIRIPPWDGQAREVGEVWRLSKGARVATCALWTHPKGGEARVTVDGEWQRGEAGGDGLVLIDLALEWREQFLDKGWAAPKPTVPNDNPEYVAGNNGLHLPPEQREAWLWTEMDPWATPEITDGHAELVAAFRRGGGRCGICGKPADVKITEGPMRPTLDHIVPQSRGGGEDRANIQLAHYVCNSRKGNRD